MSGVIGNATLVTEYSTPVYYDLDSLSESIPTGQDFITITGEAIGTGGVFPGNYGGASQTLSLSAAGLADVELIQLNPNGGAYYVGNYSGHTVDTGTKDGLGDEIYTFSVAVPTATLSSGTYILEAYNPQNQLVVEVDGIEVPNEPNYIYDYLSYAVPTYADLSIEPQGAVSTAVQYQGNASGFTPELSTDGRYLVYQDPYNTSFTIEEDLQTGGFSEFANGAAPPKGVFGASHIGMLAISAANGLPYYSAAFSAGGYSYSVIGNASDYGNANGKNIASPQSQDPSVQPVAIGSLGNVILLNGEGVVIAASDNGNVVLTATDYLPLTSGLPDNFTQIGVQYLAPAARISINQVPAVGDYAGAGIFTLSGTSDAIGQVVEVDSQAVAMYDEYGQGSPVGFATVQADGGWSLAIDPNSLAISPVYGVFFEASVTGLDGVPGRAGQLADNLISAAPTLAFASASLEYSAYTAFAGDTVTIELESSETLSVSGSPELILSNGDIASFSGSGFFSYPFPTPGSYLDFTYTPSLTAHDGPLAISSLALNGGSITDAANDEIAPFGSQNLGIALLSAPVLTGFSPQAPTPGSTLTNSRTPYIYASGIAGDTLTVFDDGVSIASDVLTYYGTGPAISGADVQVTLGEGAHVLTATVTDGMSTSSYSSALDITVDTLPPPETITALSLNGTDYISLAAQADGSITLTGSLSAPLAAGDSIVVALPGELLFSVTASAGATAFSADLSSEVGAFGISGTLSAYVENAAGNETAPVALSYTAATSRVIGEINALPPAQQAASATQPALSADGKVLAFEAYPTTYPYAITRGIFVVDLANPTAPALAVDNAEDPALSGDGSLLAFISASSGTGINQVFVEDLQTGTIQLVSQLAGAPGNDGAQGLAMSADGKTIAFADDATNLTAAGTTGEQIFTATLANGAYVISSATAGNADSSAPALSADGGSLGFVSAASNLTAAAVPANTEEIYLETLANNPATGAAAGSVALVSAAADGSAADGNNASVSVSGDGRYAVFTSYADNLVTGVSGNPEIYLKDLKTGAVSLVSASAAGVAANGYCEDPVISADGRTVVFSSTATNLVPGISAPYVPLQIYAKDLVTGAISLISAPGAVPGNGGSLDANLSGNGSEVAFDSTATNLVAQPGTQSSQYAYNKPSNIFITSVPQVITTAQTLGSAEAGLTIAAGGRLTIGAGGNALAPLIAGGTVELGRGGSVTGDISFTGTGGTLVIDANADGSTTIPGNTITGFGAGDTIELAGVAFSGTSADFGAPGVDSYTVANAGTLSIDADGTFYSLLIAGATVGQHDFVLSNDLQVTEVTCYAAGTRIATPGGEVAVERLKIGDLVQTLHAGEQKIKWIGTRTYDGRFIAGNKIALPICIKADAISENIPARDLWVSPGHAIYFDGVLIHASRLVNGVSVIQAEQVAQISYYHIELENHEIIFAENCPAETFMREDFRARFQNAAEYARLYPGDSATETSCLPLLDHGFQLHAIQRRIAARAGLSMRDPGELGPLRGYVDLAGPDFCFGWAQDIQAPEEPVCLEITADGRGIGRVLANLYRPDVGAAGYGTGYHGFKFEMPASFKGQIEVRRAADQAQLARAQTANAVAAA
jgi:Tol biopolymer transport system component